MSTNSSVPDALDDPLYRMQMQGLKDVTAAIDGRPTSSVVFSTDPGSVLNAAAGKKRFLVVDGMDGPHQDGNFAGDGAYPPFVVFDVDAQQNIAGPFDDRKSADDHRLAILRGEPALLNPDALWAYWDTHPTIQPEISTAKAPSKVVDAGPLKLTLGEFNARAHQALTEAWPLVQRGTIKSVKENVRAVVEATPNETAQMYRDLLFALQDAWPYVHVGHREREEVPAARLALEEEFGQLMRLEPQLFAVPKSPDLTIQPENATTNVPSVVKAFAGYVLYEGTRIQVDFEVPKDATEKDREAAFLAALAQQAEVNYLEVGESEHSMVNGQGSSAQISDAQRRALIAYGDARASGTPEDVARTFVDALHTHPQDGAAADQSTASGLIAELTHQRDVLAKAIAVLAIKTGSARPYANLSGPHLLMLCEEMSEWFPEVQDRADLYGFLRDSYAVQSSDDEAAFAALARTSGAEFDSMLLGAMVDARVKNLDKLALGAGVGYTLSQVGAAAVFAAGGDVEDVDWPAVQEATIQEAMVKNGQDRGAVFNTLCEHSPAIISTERRVALAHRIAEVAAGLELSKTQSMESSPRP